MWHRARRIVRELRMNARPTTCSAKAGKTIGANTHTSLLETDRMWFSLSDCRVIGVPLACFPRVLTASEAARTKVKISAFGLHREALDEDISVAGLLAGRGDATGGAR